MGTIIFMSVALFILMVAAWWKIFTKAGQPGWAIFIPIYNIIVMLEIIGKPWWWILMLLIPFVNIYFAIALINLMVKSFGKGTGYTLGVIFLSIIFIPMLAFGDAKYAGPAGSGS